VTASFSRKTARPCAFCSCSAHRRAIRWPLQVVSTLCKIFKDAANREALIGAPTPEAFAEVLLAAEEKLLSPAV
jgi:hypothetical protein